MGGAHTIRAAPERESGVGTTRLGEARHRAIAESQTEFIVRWLPDGTRTYANEAYCRFFGLSQEQAIGTSFFPLVAPEMLEGLRAEFRALTPEAPTRRGVHEVIRADGTPGWQEWTDHAIFDERGTLLEFLSVGRDVTDQRAAEEALRESELRYRSLADNIPGVIYMRHGERVSYVSEGAEALVGYSAAEFVEGGLDPVSLIHPDDFPQLRETIERAVGQRRSFEATYRVRHRDGSWVWVQDHGSGAFEGDELKYVQGFMHDVTGSREADLELQRSEERFAKAFRLSPDSITISDMQGRLLEVNEGFERIFGYSAEEARGKTSLELGLWVHPEQRELLMAQLRRDGNFRESEGEFCTKSGRTGWGELSAETVRLGEERCILLVVRDITNRKRSEQALLASKEQLRELTLRLSNVEERERRKLASDLHDRIGQALGVLRMRCGEMARTGSSEHARFFVETRALIDQTIQDTRDLTFELSPPLLYELGLGSAVEWIGERICNDHGFQFHFRDGSGRPALDPDVAGQMFRGARELLINVVKHARATSVWVSVDRDGDVVEVSIEDDGCGFEPESRGPRPGGFGLFSIREQIGLVGGELMIDSRPGRGTRATLRMPVGR